MAMVRPCPSPSPRLQGDNKEQAGRGEGKEWAAQPFFICGPPRFDWLHAELRRGRRTALRGGLIRMVVARRPQLHPGTSGLLTRVAFWPQRRATLAIASIVAADVRAMAPRTPALAPRKRANKKSNKKSTKKSQTKKQKIPKKQPNLRHL